MRQADTSRRRKIAFALTAAVVAALGLYLWSGFGERPAARAPIAAPSPQAMTSGREPLRPAVRPSSVPSPRQVREPSSQPRPTPAVFDFATITPSSATGESKDEERFRTNEWFKEEDLQHPERYFEVAARMRELNRPEERHDTLDFFIAYHDKLKRDLDAVGENQDKRQEILAAIERYDSAIARLRKVVDAEEAK
jgi:hypothetical protein